VSNFTAERSTGLFLEIDVGELLAVGVVHNETGVLFLD